MSMLSQAAGARHKYEEIRAIKYPEIVKIISPLIDKAVEEALQKELCQCNVSFTKNTHKDIRSPMVKEIIEMYLIVSGFKTVEFYYDSDDIHVSFSF